jgi:hypothetical protein
MHVPRGADQLGADLVAPAEDRIAVNERHSQKEKVRDKAKRVSEED